MAGAIQFKPGAAIGRPLGVYVHVPFCASTCDFCAFYQKVPAPAEMDRFVETVAAEADLLDWAEPAATVFWGGGTPGLLPAALLERLAGIVRDRAGGSIAEWTVEMAPASVTDDRLAALRSAGVTRISMGAQSFHPGRLEALGRQHTVAQVRRAYERIRAAQFPSVTIDLMFALPGQTEEERAADIKEAVALAPDHLSTYCLTFEEDTALWLKLARGRVRRDPAQEARFYESSWAQLEEAGYAQYEISNFARPGHACLHNLNTWRMHRWIGLGPSAASQHGGWRGSNVADIDRWREAVARGERASEDRRRLTPELLAEDALIFGLRMNAGVDWDELKGRFPEADWDGIEGRLRPLAEEGLLTRSAGEASAHSPGPAAG